MFEFYKVIRKKMEFWNLQISEQDFKLFVDFQVYIIRSNYRSYKIKKVIKGGGIKKDYQRGGQ